jgi:calcium-translocating P-type ATPase
MDSYDGTAPDPSAADRDRIPGTRDEVPVDEDRAGREPIDLLLRDLRTGGDGLSAADATRRLLIYGPNRLPRARGRGWWVDIANQLIHPLALLLWVAAVLAWVAGTPILSWAILAVIVVNALVAFLQEQQATHAVEAMEGYLPARARVLRDGRTQMVPAEQVVPGDLLVVAEGDLVCADARLLDGSVEIDMSALTGESAPVRRSAGTIDRADRLIEAPDAVFSGSTCVQGKARAVVFATASHTELGRIAALSHRVTGDLSPLERQVRRSAWLIAGVAVVVGGLFLPLGLLAGLTLGEAAIFAVGLLVANVPEGLLPTITLALAVGVRSLARSGALVKRLSAVETLGSTSVICTDKTGTLTVNRMRVVSVWWAGQWTDPGPEVPARPAQVMVDCQELDLTADPMERALRECGEQLGQRPYTPEVVFGFDPRRKRMSVVVRRDGRLVVQTKGAPEMVVPLCTSWSTGDGAEPLAPADRAEVLRAVDEGAARGLRIMALASRPATALPPDADRAETDLCLLGLVALEDPPRPEVRAAVAECHRAGLRIHVVTGDHAATATAIARRFGISADRVVGGADIDRMSDEELGRLLAQPGEFVIARSTPEGKLRIAETLRRRGEVVAMTGDGVNDAPALHRADIGVAMGRSGTDVARAAATMVLTDDNFATIAAAIREGRRAYENLRKFVLYIFAHAVPEVVPFAVFALSAGTVPLPLTVLLILAIDLGTETLPALALGRERAEPDLMLRPPRPPAQRLISGRMLVRAWLLMGSLSAVLAMGIYFEVLTSAGWHPGDPVGAGMPLHDAYLQAVTATFAAIVACQIGTAFAARTERAALLTLGVFTNRMLLWAIAIEVVFAAALIYLPPLQVMFGTAALPWSVLAQLLVCPVLVWSADEIFRWVGRRRAAHPHRPSGASSGNGRSAAPSAPELTGPAGLRPTAGRHR